MTSSLTQITDRLRNLFGGGPAYRERLRQRRARRDLSGKGANLSTVHDPRVAQASGGHKHPILRLTGRLHASGIQHEVQMLAMHAMRHYLPTLDSAIGNRRALEGDIHITSDDEGLQEALEERARTFSVGYMAGGAARKGLNTYVHKLADSADEYGLSAGEIILDEQGTTIERLVVPSSQTLSLEKQETTGLHRLVQNQSGERKFLDDKPLVQVCAFTHSSDDSPWPRPMAWSLDKVGEILLQIFEAVANGWWRFGDPSLLNAIEHPDAEANIEMTTVSGTDVQVPEALLKLKNSMDTVMKARRNGKVGDVYGYAGAGGQIKSEVIGDIDSTLMKFFTEHRRDFKGDIIGVSNTPVWMYPGAEEHGDGLGSGRANQQGMVYASDAQKRNRKKIAIARQVLDTHLLVNGDAQYIGQYELEAESANLLDETVIQEARDMQASADATMIENSFQLFNNSSVTSEDDALRVTEEQRKYLEERGVI